MTDKKKPSKEYTPQEIYESYHCLIVKININNPVMLLSTEDGYMESVFYELAVEAEKRNLGWAIHYIPSNTLHPFVDRRALSLECLAAIVREVGIYCPAEFIMQSLTTPELRLTETGIEISMKREKGAYAVILLDDVKEIKSSKEKQPRFAPISRLFEWYVKEKTPMISYNGIEISSPVGVERLWKEIGVKKHNENLIESELYREHYKILNTFSQAGAEKERYFIKDILNEAGIEKTLFYGLRKKKLIPQHYAKWGNSPYWLEDGFDKACESINKYLTKSHTKK